MKMFIDQIRELHGEPVYEILAQTKEYRKWFVVWRETVDGKKKIRNLDFLPVYGYKAEGKPDKKFYKIKCNTPNILNCSEREADKEDFEPVLKKYPNFKYIVAKYGSMTALEIFKVLRIWLKQPEMEIMLNFKLKNLATNKTFLKMARPKQKEIVKYAIEKNAFGKCLVDITGAMKYGCSIEDYKFFRSQCTHLAFKVTFDEFRNVKDKEIDIYDYAMFKRNLAINFPERLKDPYWTKFKDTKEFHRKERKVNKQIEAIKALKRAEELRIIQEKYSKAIKKFKSWTGTFNGYDIFVPMEVELFSKQGKALSQCLIWNNYPERVAKKQSLIVFLQKAGKPKATVELLPKSFKVIQFRGNHNRDAKPDEKKAFEMFQKQFIAA